ncbi:glycoside hydrolase family 18 protein [Fodinibius halophilus]|uniref:chitinase n=1 Tax=Fodinibius halophilus TaxID=1736908 RepID=A0A6M1T8Y3_9BACT|nr:glycoside hydrolase family 18 protein [Fodinibius halophilus]NGP89033.1 glycoside hydrolase family 18 protein [Fodinibius halophilus]
MSRPLLSLILIFVVISSCNTFEKNEQLPEKVIVGYLFPQEKVITEQDVEVEKLTHINYAFANIKDGKIVQGFKNDAKNFNTLNSLKKKNPDLKILISVGGWTWSGNFSDMALTKQSRKKFIDSAVEFIKEHNLDGIDLDWEYPNMKGAGNVHRPEDKRNFTLLLKELRTRLDELGEKDDKHYLSTIAAGVSKKYIANTEMAKVQRYVDFINLMTYDFYITGPDSLAGHNAPLFTNPKDPRKLSVDVGVDMFLDAGVPADKIVMGIPFYGRSAKTLSSTGHGLYEPALPPEEGLLTSFEHIKKNLENKNDFVRHWDSTASVPYLFNKKKNLFVSYEDVESATRKCKYIKEHNLRGAMFWRYQSDYKSKLVTTLFENLLN